MAAVAANNRQVVATQFGRPMCGRERASEQLGLYSIKCRAAATTTNISHIPAATERITCA